MSLNKSALKQVDHSLLDKFWNEIKENYDSTTRFYHNLTHLSEMFRYAFEFQSAFKDFEVVLYSIFYHDIVYDAASKDNEEKSAEIAKERLQKLGFEIDRVEEVFNQIIATKFHELSTDNDTNLLLDIDMSILGSDWKNYEAYALNVRKEYGIYPDNIYNPGRKKVLQHFLDMDAIFKTTAFNNKLESKARENIAREIDWY
ncbi:hypothetical protein K6119_19360 [Paracrocinitomix mangrovi]|uniref:HD domain-containing protein n=1 Tax=Paracrocinitomix mangrovi TaxID=2862509 RepID=UPI001C8F08B5|nr:hypothetical protein [Paracrocinitomix mangrovi]UKN01885.1 hypothetical protein K6119_19360 [Paracrocinitomix mangrovi]